MQEITCTKQVPQVFSFSFNKERTKMLHKLKVAGRIGQSVGYVVYGVNAVARFAGNTVTHMSNGLRNKGLFNVTLTTEGGNVVKELQRQTGSQIIDILEQMDNFGITNIDIQKVDTGVTNDNSK
jgi:hypothetical protein